MPIPFFAFREFYEELCRPEWQAVGGDLPPFEVVDRPLVLSALAHPFASAGGKPVYPTVRAKAAALFRGLVKNHGLQDGNKRMAVTCLSVFLLSNGWLPRYNNLQLYRYALRVARREGAYPVKAIERWVHRNTALMPEQGLQQLRSINAIFAEPATLEVAFKADLVEIGSFRREMERIDRDRRARLRRGPPPQPPEPLA